MNVNTKELDAQRVGRTGTMESKSSLRCLLFILVAWESEKWNRGICGKALPGAVIAERIGDLCYCYICSCLYR